MTRAVVVVQARTNSSRLPGKVLMDFGGKPILLQIINQISVASLISELVVATSENRNDDLIFDMCQQNNVQVFRGSELDVLGRMTEAAKSTKAEVVIRLTADNPFLSADLVDMGMAYYLRGHPLLDYVSNADNANFPIGLYVEIIKFTSLLKVNDTEQSLEGREHVTSAFRRKPNCFKTLIFGSSLSFNNKYLTVDSREDYNRLLPVYQRLIKKRPNFTLTDIAQLT